jgi:hypothetical protein
MRLLILRHGLLQIVKLLGSAGFGYLKGKNDAIIWANDWPEDRLLKWGKNTEKYELLTNPADVKSRSADFDVWVTTRTHLMAKEKYERRKVD